jgi:effector-binding domain-containing protein
MVRSLTRARAAWAACAMIAFAAAAEAQQNSVTSPPAAAMPAPSATGTAPAPTPSPSAPAPIVTPSPTATPSPTPSVTSGDSGSMGETVDLAARPAAYLDGKAGRDEVYSAILGAIATVRAEIAKAGLKPVDHPIAIFLEADDSGFKFRAAVPIGAAPDGKTQLSDVVKIGLTPIGKAMRFEHRGAYDDIDGTYEAITAYLDEKGVDAQDVFVEEYLNDVKSPEDPNLQVDIYVLLK